jgi:preprotein translocase subunit SecA
MLKTINEETTSFLFKIRIRDEEEELEIKRKETPKNVKYNAGDTSEKEADNQRHSSKVGRNDLCPCGSGKKYKKCCGRL